jgi:ClpP class serine protease
LSWTFVFAGERKIDGNAHEPLSERARATIQADVDRLYRELCALVAANRGIGSEVVRGTSAAVYRGERAIRARLADRVGTLDLAIAEMVAELDRSASAARTTINPSPKRSPSMVTNETEPRQHEAEAPAPILPQATTPVSRPEPDLPLTERQTAAPTATTPEPIAADALREELAEIAGIAAQAARLGVAVDAADAMRKGISSDALRRSVLDTLAARSEATSVIAAVPTNPTTGDSPIVRRARERAAAVRA